MGLGLWVNNYLMISLECSNERDSQTLDNMIMREASTVYLFSYGTLQQDDVQLATFGRLLKGEVDALPGYKSSFIEITALDVIAKSGAKFHPIVTASPDAIEEVSGTVFEITEAELVAADTYDVSDYHRINVRLRSGLDAWVYVKS